MLSWLGLRCRLVLLVLLALLPVMGLLTYSALQSRHSALELAQSKLQSQALLAAAHQQRVVGEISEALKSMASGSSAKVLLPVLCQQYLASVQARHPEFDQLGLLDTHGKSTCTSDGAALQALDFSEADFFKKALTDGSFAVGRYDERVAGIGFGVPVHDPKGELSDVAFAIIKLQTLGSVLGYSSQSPGATVVLLDHHATVLAAYPPAPDWLGRPHPDAVVQQAVQMRLQGVSQAQDAQGRQQIYAFAPVPGGGAEGLLVALSLPHERVAAQSRSALSVQMLAVLAMLLSGLACAWWMGNWLIIQPVQAILGAADEIGRGNLAARVSIGAFYRHEMGRIGLAFNRMADALQTRQGQLDAALQASEQERRLLDLILQRMREGVIAVDVNGDFLLFNDAAGALHNAKPRIGSPLAEWYTQHELLMLDGKTPCPESERPLTQALRGVTLDNQELVLRSSGVKDRILRISTRPLYDALGERVGGIAVFNDITASKNAEQALTSTNRALQMLSRSCIAINRIQDEAGLLAEVCRVAVEVGGYRMAWVGYARDDEAQSIEPMAHAGEEHGYLSGIVISWKDAHPSGCGPTGRAVRSGQPAQNNNIGADPAFYWQAAALQRGYCSSIALPLCEAGRSFGVLTLYRHEATLFHDDEVRLLQELADNLAFGIGGLRARQERLRSKALAEQAAVQLREQASLLDQAQDAIMVRNLDGTLRFWNQGAERLYGWSAPEVLGRSMAAQMYRDPAQLHTQISQTLSSNGDCSSELALLAHNGAVVDVASRCTVVCDAQGQVSGVLSIHTDIRERKRAHEAILSLNANLEERVLQRTAQLELANRQLEAFSYSVSHDLRTPLSTIDGFSQLLQKTMAKAALDDALAERSGHYLARIRASVVQMGELIDALLSLAQVSRTSLRWEAVDLSALANGLLTGCQEREPSRLARCHIEPGLLAQGDVRLLKQVLDNLLGNAWKFTAGRACAEISLTHETSPFGESIYVVRDNGAGFDMAHAAKLFGAFERLHPQSEFAGTGIGLATVARIVARHGGRIWAESAPGQGARFSFTLGTEPT
jgi:PAS domain S-box-containing protein